MITETQFNEARERCRDNRTNFIHPDFIPELIGLVIAGPLTTVMGCWVIKLIGDHGDKIDAVMDGFVKSLLGI